METETNNNQPEYKPNTIGIIIDKNGERFIGEIIDENATHILIHNPAVVQFKVNSESKDVEIMVFPVCFPEILSDESKSGSVWTYAKDNARFMSSDAKLNERILTHYKEIFALHQK
jgi:hypothetical protein